ncbi:hypothetical protein BGZ97_007044, partial [Linnemannia gamsii]
MLSRHDVAVHVLLALCTVESSEVNLCDELLAGGNQQQAKNGRKAAGSKSDGYLRSFGSTKSDWLTIEGARNWDPFAKKYKTEAYWKLVQQMHDIFRARTSDRDSSTLQNFRTYGLIFGGSTIQIHVMASLGGASTVIRRRRPLTLAGGIESFGENVV